MNGWMTVWCSAMNCQPSIARSLIESLDDDISPEGLVFVPDAVGDC